ncbi:uncharacterized protein YwgA [Pseudaminobacter salicylatoxidans]|uniref:Uncharacterized protein YwgA n=2 Tax=Pseudaminobacter salicylatoxidans TaxID=93369 RepID=A0A316BSB7_PSESE|nr:uncharacterized protein YwgA [Pseudaminobacter salicylatoxidans]
MPHEPEYYVADILHAAGGRLVSRIRLQKIAYLLDQLGAESGFDYSYHHYGPYSRDLDSAILDAEAFDLVDEQYGYRISDGARYSIFVHKSADKEYTSLSNKYLRDITKKLASQNVTVLELAATAHWLAEVERVDDWEAEIRRRKGSKTDNGRLEEATKLLADVGLPPAASVGVCR